MIHRIFSSLTTFKDLELRPGLNVLLAEKSPGATDKQTRNGAGKSSILEIIHFLLGSNYGKDNFIRQKSERRDHTFGMEFDLGPSRVRVERTGSKNTPLVVEGEFSGWPMTPKEHDGTATIALKQWRETLGKLMFGFDTDEKWGPSFRSMISYFARRASSGGMEDPMRSCSVCVEEEVQVSSYTTAISSTE